MTRRPLYPRRDTMREYFGITTALLIFGALMGLCWEIGKLI